MIYDYKNIAEDVLDGLKPRTREVLVRRFGLGNDNKETLQAIGEDYDVTRERIRQIESSGLSEVKPRRRKFNSVYDFFGNQLRVAGGIRREDIYLSILGPSTQKNYIFFLLMLEESLKRVRETESFYTLWTHNSSLLEDAQEALDFVTKKLEKKGKPVQDRELYQIVDADSPFFLEVLNASKKVARGPQGLWGLSDWSLIKPRGTKDRSYIVLKEKGKPLHFREIAKIINEGSIFSNGTKIHPQTVHNELIKHPEFVLVGRGTYALREWGYKPGTVKEVIERLLEENGPMEQEELVKEVLERRMVKRNTVLLNLRNGENFVRGEDGKYTLAS